MSQINVTHTIEIVIWNFVFVFTLGTSEAFLHAVATENQIKQSNNSLVVFSLVYLVLNVLLIRSAGAVGLITANSLSILYYINEVLIIFFFSDQFFADYSTWKKILSSMSSGTFKLKKEIRLLNQSYLGILRQKLQNIFAGCVFWEWRWMCKWMVGWFDRQCMYFCVANLHACSKLRQ